MFLSSISRQGSIATRSGGSDGWASGFCGAVGDGGAVHRALGCASPARRFCVFELRRAGGLAAEGPAAGLRVRHVPPAGVGDGGNGVFIGREQIWRSGLLPPT
jgi:hypothetical protein